MSNVRKTLPGKGKYVQGFYQVKNPQKYIGQGLPRYLSSWELRVFTILDNHPAIIRWASEPVSIPYYNPLTKRMANYLPDLLMVYLDKNGKQHAEIVEIKPSSQTINKPGKMSIRDKAALMVNAAKWQAAAAYCRAAKLGFRIISENEIFATGKKK